jgi:nicotinamide-nucleotide amidase
VADRALAAVMLFPSRSVNLARELLAACEARGLRLATAESCTAGMIIACLTEIPGASNVVERGYVTYDNRAKEEDLGVDAALLEQVGAVSQEVVEAMAKGALARAGASLSIASTGIAGPGGGTPTKPVGLVHIAVACRLHGVRHERHLLTGDRAAIRLATVDAALILALGALG